MNLKYILTLQQIKGVGEKAIEKIITISNTVELNTSEDFSSIIRVAKSKYGRIPTPKMSEIDQALLKADKIIKSSEEHDIKIISLFDKKYPKTLSLIPNPPALLHISGNIDALNKDCVAIIGTRRPTNFGVDAARKLGALFAEKGYVVVSGLAEGIDSAAHRCALDAGGETVAVLAHGLDSIYPPKNKELADAIIKNNGTLVSEYPWGTAINRSYFVARDRIQSGLSLGVFVIETDVKGGTMHTVKFCEEQNRSLIVLQHPFDFPDNPKTLGNAHLIKEKRADIVFENDDDIDMVEIKLDVVKDELLSCQEKNNTKCTPIIQSTLDVGAI